MKYTEVIVLVAISLALVELAFAGDDACDISDDEKKEIWKDIGRRLCSEDDFVDDVLKCIDESKATTPIEFKEHPFLLCREKLFSTKDPVDANRKEVCGSKDMTKKWMKCLKEASKDEKNNKGLKKDYKNDSDKLEQLLCDQRKMFQDCLKDAKPRE